MGKESFVKIDNITLTDITDIQHYLDNYMGWLKTTKPDNEMEEELAKEAMKTIGLLQYKLEYQAQKLIANKQSVLV